MDNYITRNMTELFKYYERPIPNNDPLKQRINDSTNYDLNALKDDIRYLDLGKFSEKSMKMINKEIDITNSLTKIIKSKLKYKNDQVSNIAINGDAKAKLQSQYLSRIQNLNSSEGYINYIKQEKIAPLVGKELSRNDKKILFTGISGIRDIRNALELFIQSMSQNSIINDFSNLKIQDAKIAGIENINLSNSGIKASGHFNKKTQFNLDTDFLNGESNLNVFLKKSLGLINSGGKNSDSIAFSANMSDNISKLCSSYNIPLMKDGAGNIVFSSQYLKSIQNLDENMLISSGIANFKIDGILKELNLGIIHSLGDIRDSSLNSDKIYDKFFKQYLNSSTDGIRDYISGETFSMMTSGKIKISDGALIIADVQKVIKEISDNNLLYGKRQDSFEANTQLVTYFRKDLTTKIKATLKENYGEIGSIINYNLDDVSNVVFYTTYERDKSIVSGAIDKKELGIGYNNKNIDITGGVEEINNGRKTNNGFFAGLNFKYDF